MKICIVIANYYPEISKGLLDGCMKVLNKKGVKRIKKIYAPGVYEVPFIISRNISKFDAFVALGCVIKGETPHFKFISKASIDGIMNLSIKYKKPIGNGIITCLNKKQASIRGNPNKKNKGGEAAKAVITLMEIV